MNRKQFLKTCTLGCLTGVAGVALLHGCASSQVISGVIKDSDIIVPISDFEIKRGQETTFRKYIIIRNEFLKFPICVYRLSQADYSALWMSCTHQGAELQVFGDKLQCAAHGSEFGNTGNVESGPASTGLRKFPIIIENNSLKISLR
jgi:Rieske Fe-S protein